MKRKITIIPSILAWLAFSFLMGVGVRDGEKIEYHWEITVAFFCVTALLFTIILLRQYALRKRCTKLVEEWKAADYATVIAEGNQLLSKHMDKTSKDALRVYVATSYLEQGNESSFLEELNKVCAVEEDVNKYFWLTVFYLYKKDNTNATLSEEVFCKKLKAAREQTKLYDKQMLSDSLRIIELIKLRGQSDYKFTEEDLQTIKGIHSKFCKRLLTPEV